MTAKVCYNIGIIHYQLGNIESSRESFEHAISLDSYFTIAYYALGVTWLKEEEESDNASQAFQKALTTFRTLPSVDYRPLGLDAVIYASSIMEIIRHISFNDYESLFALELDKLFALSFSKQKSLHNIDFLGTTTTISLPSLSSECLQREIEDDSTELNQLSITLDALVKVQDRDKKFFKKFSFSNDSFSYENLLQRLIGCNMIRLEDEESICYKDSCNDYICITDEEDLKIAIAKCSLIKNKKLLLKITSRKQKKGFN